MRLVRMFVHVTVSELYFGWSNPHFLGRLSIEPAHISSSVPHCPFCLHSLSCVLKPLPTPLSPSPWAGPLLTAPVSCWGGGNEPSFPNSSKFSLPFQILLNNPRPPSPQRDNPRFLSAHLPLFSQSIWALFDLYFSYKPMTIERKGKFLDIG